MNVEAKLRELDGRTLTLSEGVVSADGIVSDGMLEIDFSLSSTGETVIVEELLSAGSVIRIPKRGEMALLGFVDGDRNEGYVLGWIPRPGASPLPSISPGVVYLYAPAGEAVRIVTDARVVIDSPETRIGGDGAVDPVALSSKVDANHARIQAIVDFHQHFYTVPLIPLAPAPTTPGLPSQIIGPLSSVAASKAKAQ